MTRFQASGPRVSYTPKEPLKPYKQLVGLYNQWQSLSPDTRDWITSIFKSKGPTEEELADASRTAESEMEGYKPLYVLDESGMDFDVNPEWLGIDVQPAPAVDAPIDPTEGARKNMRTKLLAQIPELVQMPMARDTEVNPEQVAATQMYQGYNPMIMKRGM